MEKSIKNKAWRAAGYIDEPKNELYLPNSVLGSPCHMAVLAKNALVLISEFGCPHVFLTITCNPKWPEIVSILLPFKLTKYHI
jgi:hypothetical protein